MENELLQRVKRMFRRRPSTPLDVAEQRAWKRAKPVLESLSEDEWQLLEWAYSRTSGEAFKYRRKDMATFLNNVNGELDRAYIWKGRSRPKVSTEFKDAGAIARKLVANLC